MCDVAARCPTCGADTQLIAKVRAWFEANRDVDHDADGVNWNDVDFDALKAILDDV